MDLWFNDPDFHGCMFLNTTLEFPNPHDPVHQAAAAYKRRTRDHFRDLARAAGAESSAAEAFADCFTAMVEGALILRQTHGRNDAARVVRPAVEQLLRAYLPDHPDRPRPRGGGDGLTPRHEGAKTDAKGKKKGDGQHDSSHRTHPS